MTNIFRAFTPFLYAFVNVLLFELFLFFPKLLPIWFILIILSLGASVWFILGPGLKTPFTRVCFFFSPLLFLTALCLFILFLNQGLVSHILLAGCSALVGFYLYQVFVYVWQHSKYTPFSLENISSALNILTLFLLSSSAFATKLFLDLKIFALAPLIGLAAFLLTLHTFWVNKCPLQKTGYIMLLTNTLLLMEFFIALSWLPLEFLSLGAILSIIGYVLFELLRSFITQTSSRTTIKQRLLFGALLIILIALTAKWKL
jgi:hypothetical protein